MDNDFSQKIGALLSDPSALAKIASLAGSLGLGSEQAPSAPSPEPKKEDTAHCESCPAKEILPCGGAPCPFPSKSGALSKTARTLTQSRALLQSLKPFLSAERCERIDKILNMMIK